MTASSDSSPVSPGSSVGKPTNISRADISQSEPAVSGGVGAGDRTSNQWKWILAILLAAGLGFILWRMLGGRGGAGMQGPPAFPVEMERLQEESLEDSSELVGTLDSQAGVSLQPEADGRVIQIFVSSGDSVAAGDPIVQLSSERSQSDYNAALAGVSASRSSRDTARAQLSSARERQSELIAEVEFQDSEFARTSTLVERGALPQSQLDEVIRDRAVAESDLSSAIEEIAALESSLAGAEATLSQANANANATQQDLFDKTVTAPIAGIVGDIPVKLGDYVTAGSQLASITQNEDLDLEVAVPINEAERLQVGLPVELSLFGSDEVIASGNIRFVSPTTEASTQTILAKARFSSPDRPLQDDQRLEVRIIWDERPGILIPTTAVSRLGGETFVFVPGDPEPPAEGEGPPPGEGAPSGGPPPMVAKLTPVTLGALQGNEYQVLEGLNPGDTVITSGLLNLRDGVPIQPQEAGEGSGSPESEGEG
ncbi:MAG: efflux RND transporter periplasmic adaptor subunit [Cyanobacteria bacterium P01_D01_bin.36]